MLKNIPKIISPNLLKIIAEMGHGDEIILADGNFPAASCAKKLIRYDSCNVPDLLNAILKLFPLDVFVEKPVSVMQKVDGKDEPDIWKIYRNIIKKNVEKEEYEKFSHFELVERFAFYERAKKAYAIVATHEQALYANVILKKGILFPK